MLQALCYPLRFGREFRISIDFFQDGEPMNSHFETSCLWRTLFLKWIGQQNDCLKKIRWTWKCSCSLSRTCSQRHCFRGCGRLLGFLLSDWICHLAHLFIMYLYWVSASYAFSLDVSLEKVWTQRKKTNNSKKNTKTKRYQEVQDGYSSG